MTFNIYSTGWIKDTLKARKQNNNYNQVFINLYLNRLRLKKWSIADVKDLDSAQAQTSLKRRGKQLKFEHLVS
jgi:hypothetical protein